MPIEYRPINETQLSGFFAAEATAYTWEPNADNEEAMRETFDFKRSLAAFDGRLFVGGACYFDMELSVPGGSVPAAPVTYVFVTPSHRRQGIVTELMHRQLNQMHGEGIVVAALHAAESSIYGRFGYGSAAPTEVIEIEKSFAKFTRPIAPEGSFRILEDREALTAFPRIYEEHRERTPGLLTRNQPWWRLRLRKSGRKEGSPGWVKVVYERDGQNRGYVIYSADHNWQDSLPQNKLNVIELIANDDEAYSAIWSYLFNVDLVKDISAYSGINPPLWWMLADQRRLSRRTRDGLWIRLVDVETALNERVYSVDGSLKIKVEDDFCPWNTGTYLIESTDSVSHCERVDGEPDIVTSSAALASCYLGANDFHTLANSGLAEELTSGSLALASAMFKWNVSPMTSVSEPLS